MVHGQVATDSTEQEAPVISRQTEKELNESLEKAAAAAEKAAERLKVVIEDRSKKIAKSSKPYVESFLIATANLIEKLATELESATAEPVAAPSGKQSNE
ncbi:hypothetical protein GCM10027051_35990 [Niabella terrae]